MHQDISAVSERALRHETGRSIGASVESFWDSDSWDIGVEREEGSGCGIVYAVGENIG